MRKIIIALMVVALCVAIVIRAYSDPVPMNRLNQLKKGMTKSEVESILGKPSAIHEDKQWTYDRPLVFGFVNIHWMSNGTYNGEFNYERY
jgi:hypothetical protein